MGFKEYIKEELVQFDVIYRTRDELFKAIVKDAKQFGYIEETYEEAIIERERVFPTGLRLNHCGIAIPHTDAEHVKQQFISAIALQEPLIFNAMDDNQEEIPVQLVFILGFNEAHSQLDILQSLMAFIQNEQQIKQLLDATSKKALIQQLKLEEEIK